MDVIIAMEAALERKRQKIRRMEKSLRYRQARLGQKVGEREMLMRKKEDMLAKEAAMKRLADDFMAFVVEANENSGGGNAQNFDEIAMMQAIQTMLNSDNVGFAADYGGTNDAAPDIAQNPGDEATVAADEGTDSDGSTADKGTESDGSTDDGDAGGYGGSGK